MIGGTPILGDSVFRHKQRVTVLNFNPSSLTGEAIKLDVIFWLDIWYLYIYIISNWNIDRCLTSTWFQLRFAQLQQLQQSAGVQKIFPYLLMIKATESPPHLSLVTPRSTMAAGPGHDGGGRTGRRRDMWIPLGLLKRGLLGNTRSE